jgi:hypothetical protein
MASGRPSAEGRYTAATLTRPCAAHGVPVDVFHRLVVFFHRGWRIRHEASCRDVCAHSDRVAHWADVLLPGMPQARIHPGKECRDLCATRRTEVPRNGALA